MINAREIEELLSYRDGGISLKYSKWETAAMLYNICVLDRISTGNDYVLSERGLDSNARPRGVF